MTENAESDAMICATASAIMHPATTKLMPRMTDTRPDTEEPRIISFVLALSSSHTSLSEIASSERTLSAADGGGGGNFKSSGFSGGSFPYVTLSFHIHTALR